MEKQGELCTLATTTVDGQVYRTDLLTAAAAAAAALLPQAIEIRARFEQHRDVQDPRRVAALLEQVEKDFLRRQHPDPYRREWIAPLHLCCFFAQQSFPPASYLPAA